MATGIDSLDLIWPFVEALNRAIVQGGGFELLRNNIHEQMVSLAPGFGVRTADAGAFITGYEDFCRSIRIHKFNALDPQVDFFGDTAVVTHKYECTWEYLERQLEDQGLVIMVFVREESQWKMAWRSMIPGSRNIDASSKETQSAAVESSQKDIRRACLDLMSRAPVCTLTSIDYEGFPQTTAMLNLRNSRQYPSLVPLFEAHDRDMVIYMTTGMQSGKIKRIHANPKVSIQFCDPDVFHNLILLGHIEVVTDQALKDKIWQPEWTMYYPNGKHGPEYGILRLAPIIAKGWRQMSAFEITPTSGC